MEYTVSVPKTKLKVMPNYRKCCCKKWFRGLAKPWRIWYRTLVATGAVSGAAALALAAPEDHTSEENEKIKYYHEK